MYEVRKNYYNIAEDVRDPVDTVAALNRRRPQRGGEKADLALTFSLNYIILSHIITHESSADRRAKGEYFMEPICYISGAQEPGPVAISPYRPAFIIAADRGLEHLTAQGITPDLTVGDFDSLGRVPEGDNVLRHPAEKDDTDMLLAVREGLRRGYRKFLLYGGLGGRLDHTLANLQTLVFLAREGAAGWLLGDGMAVTALRDGCLNFGPGHAGVISVFCAGSDARGVNLEGLYYPLRNATLTSGFPLGVSNQFTGVPSKVSVREGELLVMWQESPESLAARL